MGVDRKDEVKMGKINCKECGCKDINDPRDINAKEAYCLIYGADLLKQEKEKK